jgi:NAD(P)-dependent dehydrogenase (short-subunit alcohol dehydrogenase family)
MFAFADRLLDASIVFSFDRTGFLRHAAAWVGEQEERSLADLVCLVTGANSGIGRATALELARRGARVWLLCRSETRGAAARDAIRRESGNDAVELSVMDVSDLNSVTHCVQGFPERQVDLLVHNAGALPAQLAFTAEGIESTFATNVVGPHLLTRLLEERLGASADARVVFVSSGGMYPARLSCRDVDWEKRRFDGVRAYSQTKRMQVVLSELYAERWKGSTRTCHAMHPGWADTPAVRTSIPRFHAVMSALLRTAEQGADTIVWLATSPPERIGSGLFFFDRAPRTTHLLPFTHEEDAERQWLWELCEARSGLLR